MSTTPNSIKAIDPMEVNEVERYKVIAFQARALAQQVDRLLMEVIEEVRTCDQFWLRKGRLTSFTECLRDLVNRL